MIEAIKPITQTQLLLDKKSIQRMSAVVALLSIATLMLVFYFLPGFHYTAYSFLLIFGLGALFFVLYILLPQIYLHETFLLVGDAIYVALITYAASLAGEYGILILFLYFIIIVADALKYPISEYITIVIFTLQAAFFYIIVLAPFPGSIKIGILAIFVFSTISIATFVWYFVYQTAYERSLRYVLEKKTTYLAALNQHLQAVDTMRNNMLQVTSHEFQTPLTAIQNSLVLLANSKISELNPKQLELLEIAAHNNKRLVGLVKEMLNVARIQSGTWTLTVATVDLNEIVTDLLKTYQPVCDEKKLHLLSQLPQLPLVIQGDKNLLTIVFKNLIDNATKYTPSGGSIRVVLGNTATEIYFCVQDNGIGIAKELQPRLFSEFFRTKEAIQARPDGYGIGLHFSKLIVERHQGSITVQSEENKGALFTIHLPISLTSTAPKEAIDGTKTS